MPEWSSCGVGTVTALCHPDSFLCVFCTYFFQIICFLLAIIPLPCGHFRHGTGCFVEFGEAVKKSMCCKLDAENL